MPGVSTWRVLGYGLTRMPRDPYIRDKFTREISHARKVARDYFERYPKDRYDTVVESWADIQSYNIEFVMKRLREPKVKP
jgi:hypothetical protein